MSPRSWHSRKLRYWAESSGRSRRTGPLTNHPVPQAAPRQALLEGLLLECFGRQPDYCAHPLGIASVVGTDTSLTLNLDPYLGGKRFSLPEHCLAPLLPAIPSPGAGCDPGGITGLRISGIDSRRRALHLDLLEECGGPATVVLVLPASTTDSWEDIEHRHALLCEAQGFRPVWREPAADPAEREFLAAYPSLRRSLVLGAPTGSALLRRAALFHTVTDFYRVQCWYADGYWTIDATIAYVGATSHDQLIQRLCDPRWGLFMKPEHRYCWCAPAHQPAEPDEWTGHTCSFYFRGSDGWPAEPVFLRVHTMPEGRDLTRQAASCRAAGAAPDWLRRVFNPCEETGS